MYSTIKSFATILKLPIICERVLIQNGINLNGSKYVILFACQKQKLSIKLMDMTGPVDKVLPRKLKGEIGPLFFTPVLMLWRGCHITGHVWRRVIVPSDLAQSFGAIRTHRYRLIHCAITNMHAWFSLCGKGNTHLLSGLSYETMWRYSNSSPYVTTRELPQQITPLNFLGALPTIHQ